MLIIHYLQIVHRIVLYCFLVTGKDLEGEKEFYSNEEWQERVEKWKVRQEKRGLLNKEDGKEDQGEEDEYL